MPGRDTLRFLHYVYDASDVIHKNSGVFSAASCVYRSRCRGELTEAIKMRSFCSEKVHKDRRPKTNFQSYQPASNRGAQPTSTIPKSQYASPAGSICLYAWPPRPCLILASAQRPKRSLCTRAVSVPCGHHRRCLRQTSCSHPHYWWSAVE